MRYCIVGAGFSGAVIGRALAEAGHKVLVVDERRNVAGNCHTERDAETGVMIHIYGPHIFHTSDQNVWDYINRFGDMMLYQHRVRAIVSSAVYSLPVNLLTINQFFNTIMSPDEARSFINSKSVPIGSPSNFEEQALSMIGPELYTAFFRGYTRKQWGIEPTKLPAAILKRLPLRFDYEDSYFSHRYQAIPKDGYTKIVQNILDVPGIEIKLGVCFEDIEEKFAHIIYSGPIDRFFNYKFGRLGYRTLEFERFRVNGDFQGTAVMNYCDEDVPFTRITEHKHFAPWEKANFEQSVCYREFSRYCGPDDIPYYPIRQTDEESMLRKYTALAETTSGVTFVGRLGSYRYLDMDVTIAEALSISGKMIRSIRCNEAIPAFYINPLNH